MIVLYQEFASFLLINPFLLTLKVLKNHSELMPDIFLNLLKLYSMNRPNHIAIIPARKNSKGLGKFRKFKFVKT